jgi:hypothetical protein
MPKTDVSVELTMHKREQPDSDEMAVEQVIKQIKQLSL